MAIRFSEHDARVMGRAAAGVKGINLGKSDRVVGLIRIGREEESQLLTVTENGYGKRTGTREYLVQSEDGSSRPQGRGGKGRRDIATGGRNGKVVALLSVAPQDDLMLITSNGMIVRINVDTVRSTGRGTKGVRCINLTTEDRLVSVARVADEGDNIEQTAND